MTDPDQTSPSPMVRAADLLHRALKLARKRWYVVLVLMILCAWPVLLTIWKVHKVQVAIKQFKIDNPKVKNWKYSSFGVESESIGFNEFGGLKDICSLKYIIFKDLDIRISNAEVTDISALKGMPLTHLSLYGTWMSKHKSL